MKDNAIKKITSHCDKDEIVAKLVLGSSPKEINQWLKSKYGATGDQSLIVSTVALTKFKDEYLDLYNTIKQDLMQVYHQPTTSTELANQDPAAFVKSNSAYRAKLQEYIDKEVDLKSMLKNLIVAAEFRIEQLYDIIQANPNNTRPDYVILQWFQQITNLLEKQENILNGSSDKIVQQNTINIQILDQHIGVFHKVIREVISRLDYDTSLLFVDILNQELKKLKPTQEEALAPIDTRLLNAKKMEDKLLNQLDVPSS